MKKSFLYLLAMGVALVGCAGSDTVSAPYVRIGQKARSSGNPEAAINFYNKAIEVEPSNPAPYLGLAEVYVDMKLLDAAKEYLVKAERNGADPSRVAYIRGKIYLLLDDNANAEKEFKKYETADSLNALGALYDSKGDHKQAQMLYRRVISMEPKYIDAYNNMGLSLLLCDAYKEAIFYLENACALPDSNPTYRGNLAFAYGLAGQIAKAKAIYAQDYEGAELEQKVAYLEDIIASRSDK